jgi:hypothetical protein
MNKRRTLQFAFCVGLVGLLLTGCGGPSEFDLAVCDAYQNLIDAWPANSEEVQAANSAEEIWNAVTDAGEALVTASELAESGELKEAGRQAGEKAVRFFTDNSSKIINQGFIPFFSESFVGGGELSRLCEEIGNPVTVP